MSCGCAAHDPDDATTLDPMYRDLSVPLGGGVDSDTDARNYILGVHRPIFANPLGGPSEGPTPAGMNRRAMPILEARSMDLSPMKAQGGTSAEPQTPATVDESALYLDEGYIGGDFQAA